LVGAWQHINVFFATFPLVGIFLTSLYTITMQAEGLHCYQSLDEILTPPSAGRRKKHIDMLSHSDQISEVLDPFSVIVSGVG